MQLLPRAKHAYYAAEGGIYRMSSTASTAKGYRGWGMEGMVAKWYAGLTKKSLDEFKLLARRVTEQIAPGDSVLEVAPGPGYFAIECAKLGDYRVTALDISETFVEIARKNARRDGVQVDFRLGNASEMPFENDSFDFVVCRAAFKNFSAPIGALREMYRVLKPKGRALIIDLRRDTPQHSITQAVDGMHLGRVNGIITKLTFKHMLIKRAYTKSQFENMLSQTSFQRTEIKESLTGLEIVLDKAGS
jgi:ubiquinone/menaquinone biosynthesis C-methylase UbiE